MQPGRGLPGHTGSREQSLGCALSSPSRSQNIRCQVSGRVKDIFSPPPRAVWALFSNKLRNSWSLRGESDTHCTRWARRLREQNSMTNDLFSPLNGQWSLNCKGLLLPRSLAHSLGNTHSSWGGKARGTWLHKRPRCAVPCGRQTCTCPWALGEVRERKFARGGPVIFLAAMFSLPALRVCVSYDVYCNSRKNRYYIGRWWTSQLDGELDLTEKHLAFELLCSLWVYI